MPSDPVIDFTHCTFGWSCQKHDNTLHKMEAKLQQQADQQ
jgi:hypothetical protein